MKTGINMKNKAFKTTTELGFHDGFQMTFKNGCTISVQFSKHTYSDAGETTAEVAAWDNQGNWLMFDEDKWTEIENGSDVMARQSASDVAKLIYTLSQW
jgi:hypothetical protein